MPHIERKMHAAMEALFAIHGLVRSGAILDAGANDGVETIFLARLLRNRTIIAIEPVWNNVKILKEGERLYPNIRAIHGGLGSVAGTSSYPLSLEKHHMAVARQVNSRGSYVGDNSSADSVQVHFNVTTVDLVFADRPLAFAHWDVEGAEVAVIEGARRTIGRDRPVFSVEGYPRSSPADFALLVRLVRSLGYELYEVEETCGYPWDCRNFVCVPNERRAALGSPLPGGHRGLPFDRYAKAINMSKYVEVLAHSHRT